LPSKETLSPSTDNEVPTPFFTDTRTLAEKLEVDRRDWIPTKNADDPKTIFGLILERGSYVGKNDTHPTARVLTDENIEWGVIAFHGWLHSAFDRKDPRVGDFVAIAYQGTKPAKKAGDSDAYIYALEVERNPEAPLFEPDTSSDDPSRAEPNPIPDESSYDPATAEFPEGF